MSLSIIVYDGDGVTNQFTIPFALGYITEADITCRVGEEVDGGGDPVYRPITFISEELVEVGGDVPGDGVKVVFLRSVAREQLLVDYEDGSILNEDNLNLSQKQLIMLIHECLDGRFSIQQQNWDMNGWRITNLGDPVVPSDAVTFGYLQNYLEGISSGVISVAGLTGNVSAVALTTALGLNTVSADIATKASKAANLSDLADIPTARDNLTVYSKTQVDAMIAALQGVPSGVVSAYAGATAPAGYLMCHGQAVSRTTYAALFTAIGITYGAGDGSTTFNVPELRAEFIRGLDSGRGLDEQPDRVLGSTQTSANLAHTHDYTRRSSNIGPITGGGGLFLTGTNDSTSPTISSGGAESRPHNVAMNFIIKV